ncbi:MAG TPA: tetratricopeptide repeat protein [Candidatus Polarisedimenticolia bacterium]|jgi:tetratricopeptide (TPR) repeat protein|nr:tetratricopeptide repeat protein [Candidatus Polarisedimenticolia bacterium]
MMIKISRRLVLSAAVLAALPSVVQASGGSSMPPPSPGPGSSFPSTPRKPPAEEAIDHYNAGVRMRDRAVALQKEAAQAADEKERAKLEKKAMKEFDRAIGEFREAAQKNPLFYQASSDLGFCLRKTGDYPAALEAYDRAISLAQNYAPAIEYRAEAYLGLDRTEEAKQAYLQLFASDRARADELMAAMKAWVEKHSAAPGPVAPDAVKEFSSWVQQREEIATQTPSVSQLQERKW